MRRVSLVKYLHRAVPNKAAITRAMQLIGNWRKRHRQGTNFWLHMIGIPACFVGAPLLLIFRQWWLALAMFAAGYALQFIGHLVEGTRSGEGMFLKESLRKILAGRRTKR